MDNCEHVLTAAAASIGEILRRAGAGGVLATSRERLGTTGETLVLVSPLAARRRGHIGCGLDLPRSCPDCESGFNLERQETVAAVIEICQTLDGLPLGIELAARDGRDERRGSQGPARRSLSVIDRARYGPSTNSLCAGKVRGPTTCSRRPKAA